MRPEGDTGNGERQGTVQPLPGESCSQPTAGTAIRVRIAARPGERTLGDAGDTIIVAEIAGETVGSLHVRTIPLVHDMEIGASLLARKIGDALLHYAAGYVRASGFGEAMMLVSPENDKMHRFMIEHGAIQEEPAACYLMGVE